MSIHKEPWYREATRDRDFHRLLRSHQTGDLDSLAKIENTCLRLGRQLPWSFVKDLTKEEFQTIKWREILPGLGYRVYRQWAQEDGTPIRTEPMEFHLEAEAGNSDLFTSIIWRSAVINNISLRYISDEGDVIKYEEPLQITGHYIPQGVLLLFNITDRHEQLLARDPETAQYDRLVLSFQAMQDELGPIKYQTLLRYYALDRSVPNGDVARAVKRWLS